MVKKSAPILIGILTLALLLRLPLLNGSFWLDEAAQALESARPWSQQLELTPDFQPPFLHLLTAIFIRINTAEWWLRTWGALMPGLLTILFIFQLGNKLGKNQNYKFITGGVASLLLATSSFHIYFSQELRPYSLPAFWAVLSWFLLLTQRQRLFNQSPQPGWWKVGLGWALVSLLGLYTSYLYPFLLIGQVGFIGLYILNPWRKKQVKFSQLWPSVSRWLTLGLVIILGFLPWMPSFLAQLQAGQLLRAELPNWETVVSTPQLKALGLIPAKFLFGVSDLSLTPYFILLSTAFALLLGLSFYLWWQKIHLTTQFSTHKQLVFQIAIFWLIIPLFSAWLVSFFVPVLQPKRVLFLLPGFYLLLSLVLSPMLVQARTAWQKRQLSSNNLIPVSLLLLLLFLNLSSTVAYWRTPSLQRENWRGLWLEIDQKYSDATPKIFVFSAPFASWFWYDLQYSHFSMLNDYSLFSQNSTDESTAEFIVSQASNVYTAKKIIYFDYMTDLTDPDRLVIKQLNQHGYLPTDLLDYPQIGYVRIFDKTETNE